MSRAYRIRVRESLRRVIRAHDRVSTQLELLEVLPPEQMAQLLREELDQAVNRITAEALKQKAAQIGQIKELTEDPQSGSLTIVLEV